MALQLVLQITLLALQLCLGFWQIMKFTPVGAIIRCSLDWCMLKLRLPSTYAVLKGFSGRIFKVAKCRVTTAGHQAPTRGHYLTDVQCTYLGKRFRLRREENKLFVNDEIAYYITDVIWNSLMEMVEVSCQTVFLKGYKEFWQGVASGGVMSFTEVLDCLILDNHKIVELDSKLLLPVNLSVSELKLLKGLNLLGLALRTRKVYWLIPIMLSFTAALLEFCTTFRVWLYGHMNKGFCCAVHLLCERLSPRARRHVYSLGYWVENLKPGNDIELKVVRGNMFAVIGGGAKVSKGSTLQPQCADLTPREQSSFTCKPFEFCCTFHFGRCFICYTGTSTGEEVACTEEEFERMKIFVSCLAKNRSGSMRCCSPRNVVRVRSWRESVICYAKTGFPPVYELELLNAVVL